MNNATIVSDTAGGILINSIGYEFLVSLEIREKLNKNSYTAVPRDRSGFKLRCNTDKEVSITVIQTQTSLSTLPMLHIDRCFGVLMGVGKLVKPADMKLLEWVTLGYPKNEPITNQAQSSNAPTPTLSPYVICAEWKASDKNFEQLNLESTKTHITIAVDLVMRAIQDPVRFVIVTPVTIQSQNEIRLMDHFNFSGSKKSVSQRFYLQLKDNGDGGWVVSSIDPTEEIIEPVSSSTQSSILKNLVFPKMKRSTSVASIEKDESPTDYCSDGDEPLLSGTGAVPKECSQEKINEWNPIIMEWDSDKRPKSLAPLVRLGIPETIRGNIWLRLANVYNKTEMTDMYRVLLTKDTKCETVIQRDIHRTFPAHKFFRETGGSGNFRLLLLIFFLFKF